MMSNNMEKAGAMSSRDDFSLTFLFFPYPDKHGRIPGGLTMYLATGTAPPAAMTG
jgi:hypothetical protein